MKKSLAALLFIILASCGGGGGSSAPPTPQPPPPGPTAIELFTADIEGKALPAFYDAAFGGLLRRSQENVVASGLQGLYPLGTPQLNDWSAQYQTDTWTMYRLAMDKLQTYDRSALDAAGQLEFDIFEWYVQDNLDAQQFELFGFPATYGNFGVPRQTQRFFEELHPLKTAQDAQNFLERLSVFDTKFTSLEHHLQRQANAGIIEPQRTLDIAIFLLQQYRAIAPVDNPIYQRFRDDVAVIPGLSTAQRANFRDLGLQSINHDVIPAYTRLINTLQSLRANAPTDIGVGQYPNGDAYYAYALRHRTTTDLTPAEIHQLGLDELARIHAEMDAIFAQLGYPYQTETLQELFARVEADGGIVQAADSFTTFDNLVAFAAANLPQAFDIFPQADVVVLPDPFGGFYIAPSFDGSRPGAFYAGTDFDQPYATMPSLTFHESLPGHHMQIAIQAESNLANFRKLVRTTAFTEGWALYAERLAYELGWYDNDVYGNLGRLQFEALRAARLVMDTGIHSMGWTFDQAAQFNVDNVGASLESSRNATLRYSVFTGQATAYMIGMLAILSERQRAMDALGNAFDLKGFHTALLTNGAVPLFLLDDVVDQYIATNTP